MYDRRQFLITTRQRIMSKVRQEIAGQRCIQCRLGRLIEFSRRVRYIDRQLSQLI